MGSLAQVLIIEDRLDAARRMIIGGRLPLSQIAAYLLLDQDTIEELAVEMGVILPDTPVPPWR